LDIDYKKILKAEQVFEDCMKKYEFPPEATATSPNIVLSPMPGGALTANTLMMRENKTFHLYPKVIEEMADVVARSGFGSSVTPVSQFYFQQAYMNVMQGKWKKIVDGYGQMVLGYFGKTPRPADPEIIKIAAEQLKKEPFTGDPLEVIKPGIEPARKLLKDNNLPDTDENIFIVAACEDKGLQFLQGKAPFSVPYVKETKVEEPKTTSSPTAVANSTLPQNLTVNVNGKDYQVKVSAGSSTVNPAPKTTPTPVKPVDNKPTPAVKPSSSGSSSIVKAPLHGIVLRILVKVGDRVEKDQPAVVLEAMKMENEIYCNKSGTITNILIKEGESVEEGHGLFELS
jgi:pyruvate carboxylase subunit B